MNSELLQVADRDANTAATDLSASAGRPDQRDDHRVGQWRPARRDERDLRRQTGNPTSATIAGGLAVGAIVDDDPPISISISDVTKAEGKRGQTTLFIFTVTLSAAYDQAVTMSFRTVNGTATTGDNDHVAKTGTLTFAPGETTKTITIEVKTARRRPTRRSTWTCSATAAMRCSPRTAASAPS